MLGSSWRIRSKTSSPATASVPASARALRVIANTGLVAIFLCSTTGCQTTEVAARSTYDANAAPPANDEFSRSARILFKRCVTAFGDDEWAQIRTDAKRLEALAERWSARPTKDAARSAAHREWTQKLAAAAKRLDAAAEKKDAALVSAALGETSAAVAKLREIDPPAAKTEE